MSAAGPSKARITPPSGAEQRPHWSLRPQTWGTIMNPTRKLHDIGQRLWLDTITRDLLDSGTLKRYIDEFSITGLTSNPTIFDHAIAHSDAYDESIRKLIARGRTGEAMLFDLMLEDLTRAADLFLPIHEATDGVDGWVSLEVAPQLAYDAAGSIAQA